MDMLLMMIYNNYYDKEKQNVLVACYVTATLYNKILIPTFSFIILFYYSYNSIRSMQTVRRVCDHIKTCLKYSQ